MTKHILVFSDSHGRIPLLLRLAWQWQRESGQKVHLILVSGDLGVWPDSKRLDSATNKHSLTEPMELGFQAFQPVFPPCVTGGSDDAAAHLSQARKLLEVLYREIEADIVFVGGNHEDYEYLKACMWSIKRCQSLDRDASDAEFSYRSIVERSRLDLCGCPGESTSKEMPVDVGRFSSLLQRAETRAPLVPLDMDGRIWWLPPGCVYRLGGVTISGISGIDPEGCGRDPGRYHDAAVLTEEAIIDATLRVLDQVRSGNIDVFLTHDSLPDAVKRGKGTLKLLEAVTTLNPRYHFYGHYHSRVAPISYAEWIPRLANWHPQAMTICPNPPGLRTMGIHLNKLTFDGPTLRKQVMGLLQIDTAGQWHFEFVEGPWLDEITSKTMWRGDSA